jgi:hypothetical protein
MAMLPRRAAYADFLVNQQGVSQAEARRMAEQQYPVRSREDEIRGLTLNLQSINERLRQEPPPRVGNAAFGITPPVSPLEQQRRELSDQLARLQGRPTEQEAAAQRAQQQQAAARQRFTPAEQARIDQMRGKPWRDEQAAAFAQADQSPLGRAIWDASAQTYRA